MCQSAEAHTAVLLVHPPISALYESKLNNGFPLIMHPAHSL